LLAADCVTPESINFMAKYGRGLICLTLTKERCERLRLPPMVNDNRAAHSTAFTVSIEAAVGVTTGISAADRATTVRAAVAPDAQPRDLVQPGGGPNLGIPKAELMISYPSGCFQHNHASQV
jgi:3,4-dihydroxy 2-butanone 4-phosphate synthase/GTP cyclohydrolase II